MKDSCLCGQMRSFQLSGYICWMIDNCQIKTMIFVLEEGSRQQSSSCRTWLDDIRAWHSKDPICQNTIESLSTKILFVVGLWSRERKRNLLAKVFISYCQYSESLTSFTHLNFSLICPSVSLTHF